MFFRAIVILVSILPASCGNGSSGGGTSGLDGSWASSCFNMGVPGAGAATFSIQNVLSFKSGNLESLAVSYSAAGCTSVAKDSTLRRTGTYTAGEASAEVPDATNLDLIEAKVFFTVYSDSQVTSQNSASNCEKSNWQKGEEVEITGLTCILLGDVQPKSTYSIYKIAGSSLFTGQTDATNDGTSAEKRTKTISASPLTRM